MRVVVHLVGGKDLARVVFSDDEDAVEGLAPDAADDPLAVAEILPQSWLIALAQREVSSKGPLARQHLDHYLAGIGSDFVEDVAALYGQDGGFKLESEIQIGEAGELKAVP